ncbi:hypothetical protein GCM10009535_58960 [Streptomyces thermocarboxydovorans]|uniref:Uncharacterized protein n=1 Tax=Streptomyces thermocarboxydovorans TaxID=59298 RepID=A0ABN1HX80_9ACTN
MKKLKGDNKTLARLFMTTVREKNELDKDRLESALRLYLSELDYDLYKGIANPEDGTGDRFPEEAEFFLRCWEIAGEG